MNPPETTTDGKARLSSPLRFARRPRFLLHVLLILLVGACARIPFYLAVRPIWSGDSPGYWWFYYLLRHHIFFLGERTPLYPMFLGIAQWLAGGPSQEILSLRAEYAAVLLQSACDVVAAVPFYALLRELRIGERTALVAALFFVTIPAISGYEMNILNMSLSVCLMVWASWCFVVTLQRLASGRGVFRWSLATGVALSLAVLNRPDMLIFAVLLLAAMAAMWMRLRTAAARGALRAGIARSALWVVLPLAISVLGWMLLMYIGIGQFRITTLDGWNRSRTVYNLFDRVPPEDALIGEIMSRTYEQSLSRHADTNLREIMWQAQGELFANAMQRRFPMRDTATEPGFLSSPIIQKGRSMLGLKTIPCSVAAYQYCWEFMRRKDDVGDYLGRVSWKLARRYPAAWLHNMTVNFLQESFNFRYGEAKGAVEGYRARTGDGESIGKNKVMGSLTAKAMHAEAPCLLLFYLVTWGFVIAGPWMLLRSVDEHWWRNMGVVALATASVGTLVGTCVLAGLNRVYSLPHLAVFTICAAYGWEHRRRIFAACVRRSGQYAR